jgi:replicative DNA helicase
LEFSNVSRPIRTTQPERQSPTAQAQAKAEELIADRGLPSAPEAELFVLGAILMDGSLLESALEFITTDDLHLESNRRLFGCMVELRGAGENVDRITLVNQLRKRGWLEAVGGLAGVSALGDGVPEVTDITPWLKVVREKSNLRAVMYEAQRALQSAASGVATSEEIAAGLTERLQRVQVTSRDDLGRTPEQIINSYAGGIAEFMDPSLRKRGLPTGFTKLDEMLGGGLQDGELIVLAARPGVGKTAFALNVISHLCLDPNQRRSAVLFSLETTGSSLLTRMMTAAALVDAHRFRSGYLNGDERNRLRVALSELVDCRLRIFDKFGITMPEIEKHSRRLVKDEGAHLIVIDYLQLIGSKGKSENRNIEVGQMTRQLKHLTEELKVPIVILSQLSRSSEKRPGDKRPILSDLRDSGSVEQDSDVVLFIHREEVYRREDETLKGLAEVILQKNRNGPIGVCQLRFLSQFTRFENKAEWGDMPEGK